MIRNRNLFYSMIFIIDLNLIIIGYIGTFSSFDVESVLTQIPQSYNS